MRQKLSAVIITTNPIFESRYKSCAISSIIECGYIILQHTRDYDELSRAFEHILLRKSQINRLNVVSFEEKLFSYILSEFIKCA